MHIILQVRDTGKPALTRYKRIIVSSLPYVFTEQGVAMLSSVLRSKRAIQVNIQIMKTFVKLRNLLVNNRNLESKILELEKKYDEQFKIVFEVLRDLVKPPPKSARKIGY